MLILGTAFLRLRSNR
ncbi:erythromycin resistance leader peptide [Trueperella pyogenes]|uniref:Erythromycin resistance leader peptide n=1 Tax=Trueperella pyogenes TaxID=1661 RepID=A0A3Q9GJ14_9ACTO|nr:erythromycin resistance leader peptide [Trueperella pyogenes]AZR07893.1 erythromycin resistance leader peptide [Trueperella pyogenes]